MRPASHYVLRPAIVGPGANLLGRPWHPRAVGAWVTVGRAWRSVRWVLA